MKKPSTAQPWMAFSYPDTNEFPYKESAASYHLPNFLAALALKDPNPA
jgi:hypothetical protein